MCIENQDAKLSKDLSQKHFVRKMIFEYIALLGANTPNTLAFDYNDSEVLVWAEINDNDEQKERELILAEAKINAAYHQFGFDMTTMIVEKSDKLPVPNHYQLLK